MLARIENLRNAWSFLEPAQGDEELLGVAAARAWATVCCSQLELDEFMLAMLKLRYGDQDKIAPSLVSSSIVEGSMDTQHVFSVIDDILDGLRGGASALVLPLWQPALLALIRVSKSNQANPVIRKQCFKFALDWLRASITCTPRLDLFSLPAEPDPLLICSCGGFPSGSSDDCCFVHGVDDGGALPSWAPVDFRFVVALINTGLTDVWSAIRKDVSNRLFSIVDALPLPHVHRVIAALVRIASLKDRREQL